MTADDFARDLLHGLEPEPDWTLGYIDFPTAWWLARRVEHPNPKCSYAQTGGGLLCDCGAINVEWERRRKGAS
jgi:hypothetical protein